MGGDRDLCTCVQNLLEVQIFFSEESSKLSPIFSEQQCKGQQNEISQLGDLETPTLGLALPLALKEGVAVCPLYSSGTKEIYKAEVFFPRVSWLEIATSQLGSLLGKV